MESTSSSRSFPFKQSIRFENAKLNTSLFLNAYVRSVQINTYNGSALCQISDK
jgi:hypothetical protein